jgi:hypothetical protein
MAQRLALMAVMCVAGLAIGFEPPTEQPKTEPAPGSSTDVLSGPKVKETQTERSLIRRDFRGRVQRLEANPAEAAVELLSLDAATKAKVQAVLDERTAMIDRLVRDNLELLVKFQNTNDRRGKLGLLREYREVFKELEAKGKLQDQVKAALPKDQAARYDELIAGYWDTIVADAAQEAKQESKNAKEPAKQANRGEILIREGLLAFGGEIRRSYERQIAAKTKELEEFLAKLGLSPEKEAKIRTMFSDSFQATMGKPTPQQRRDLALRVLGELNAEQRKIVIQELLGRSDPAPSEGDKPDMKPQMQDGDAMAPMSESSK